MKCSMTGQKKVTFYTGDCLIEVTAYIGLTVLTKTDKDYG